MYTFLSIPLIPYFGLVKGYKFILMLIILFIISVVFYKIFILRKIQLSKEIKKLIILFLGIITWMMFSTFYNMVITDIPFSYADMSEFFRPVLLMSVILGFYLVSQSVLLRSDISYISLIIIRSIIIISIINFSMTFFPYIRVEPFSTFANYFGEGPIYSAGYASYRAFGIIGQPGKEAIFSAMLIFFSIILLQEKRLTTLLAISIILNFIAIILTFSRTSLISLIFFVFLYGILDSRKTLVKSIFIILIIFFMFDYYFDLSSFGQLFYRGMGHGSLSTLGHRMHLKEWALDTISQNLGTLLVGIGPCKDYIGQFTTSYAFDLTLRNPDSSFTVWYLRYGIIGLAIEYLPYLYIVYLSIKSYSKSYYAKAIMWTNIMLLFISFFDPPYHEPKTVIFLWLLNIVFLVQLGYVKNSIMPLKSKTVIQ